MAKTSPLVRMLSGALGDLITDRMTPKGALDELMDMKRPENENIDIPEFKIRSEELIVDIVFDSGILKSKGEVRRLIKQRGMKLDDNIVVDIQAKILPKDEEQILKIGKRRFLKVVK